MLPTDSTVLSRPGPLHGEKQSHGPLQVLTINAGSTSIKFSLYSVDGVERRILSAACEGVGLGSGRLWVKDEYGSLIHEDAASIPDHECAASRFFQWLAASSWAACIDVVGHRVAHGGLKYASPVHITPSVIGEITSLQQLDPEHLVPELRAIQAASFVFPIAIHVACFDTAFHRGMPDVAQRHPLPRAIADQGVLRFGFHGLAYEYLLAKLVQDAGAEAAGKRIVMAHLGGGASLAAVNGGRSVDTTMGFMPSGGLMMGTRTGDICPGVLLYLLLDKKLTPSEVNHTVNFQSGLLGVSGVSREMRDLVKVADTNPGAAQAIELFCYTAKKHLGSMAAVLGGVDTLIFSGGIGENAPSVRHSICERMEHVGIRLDPSRNRQNAPVISADDSKVVVRVMAANEEVMIARASAKVGKELRKRSAGPKT